MVLKVLGVNKRHDRKLVLTVLNTCISAYDILLLFIYESQPHSLHTPNDQTSKKSDSKKRQNDENVEFMMDLLFRGLCFFDDDVGRRPNERTNERTNDNT